MLKLHSKTDKPDFNYLNTVLQDSMSRGIKVQISDDMNNELNNELISAKLALQGYGLYQPTKPQEILKLLQELAEEDAFVREYCCVDGKWTSNKTALKKLAHSGNQFAIDLMYYRRVSRYLSYLNSLNKFADAKGLIHPVICGSTTNRVQYKEPSLMNIPKQVLWSVITPRTDKWSLYSIDIKNQEPWILINMLNIEELKNLLAISTSGSLYDMLFATFYHKEPTPIERKEFKVAWNALTYGASKRCIINSCYNIDSEVVYTYFNKLKEYKEYKKKMNALGYGGCTHVETLFGSKLLATGATKTKVVRQLMNLGIQGTGADILAFLVKHFEEETKARKISRSMRIYFTRHDECIIEVSKSYEKQIGGEDAVCGLLFDIFEHQIDDWEPFRLDVHKLQDTMQSLFMDNSIMEDEEDYEED